MKPLASRRICERMNGSGSAPITMAPGWPHGVQQTMLAFSVLRGMAVMLGVGFGYPCPTAQARETLADHTSGLSSPIIVGMNSGMCTARCITSPSVIPTDEVIVDQSHFTSSPLRCSQIIDYLSPMAPVSTNTLMARRVGLCPCEVSSFFKARKKTLFARSTVTSAWCLADLRTKLRSVYRSQFSRNVRALL